MSSVRYDFEITQGETWEPGPIYYRDETGAPINLTGRTARLQIRDGYDAPSAALALTTENGGITLGGVAGTITPLATAAQTATLDVPNEINDTFPVVKAFIYELELLDGARVEPLLYGQFNVRRDIAH